MFEESGFGKELLEVEKLNSSLKKERIIFQKLWKVYKKKRVLTRKIQKGDTPPSKSLKKIKVYNRKLLEELHRVLHMDKAMDALIRKILYESLQRLHKIEAWLWRYGREDTPSMRNKEIIGKKGRRAPYSIEQNKIAAIEVVQDEKKLEILLEEAKKRLEPEFKMLHDIYGELTDLFIQENTNPESKHFKQEDTLFVNLNHTLSDIVNTVLTIAKEITQIEMDEQKIENPATSLHKVGVLLIHGHMGDPDNMEEYAKVFQNQGYITYNLRIPGHGKSFESYFNTPLEEIESFFITAFKQFYQYMKQQNANSDMPEKEKGKFYIAGISIGAMIPLHILAKKWNGTYPYQSMIKGFICMSAVIYAKALGKVLSVQDWIEQRRISFIKPENLLTKFAVRYYNFFALFRTKKDARSTVDKTINELLKKGFSVQTHETIFRQELQKIIRIKLEELKHTMYTGGELYMHKPEEFEAYVQEVVDIILDNLKKGKTGFAKNDVTSLKSRALTKRTHLFSWKIMSQITSLMNQLRKDIHHIHIPILVIHGRYDTLSHPKTAEEIYKAATNPIKQLAYVYTGHVPTLDSGNGVVFSESLMFIKRVESLSKSYHTPIKKRQVA